MQPPFTTTFRVLLALVVLASAGSLAGSYTSAGTAQAGDATDGSPDSHSTDRASSTSGPHASADNRSANTTRNETTAPPRTVELRPRRNQSNGTTNDPAVGTLTVVATQGFFVTDESAELVAFSGSGDIVYHDDSYRVYFDIDPVPDARFTVQYVAAEHFSGEGCEMFETFRCTRNVIERVNLSTGNVTRIYAKKTPGVGSTRWHDVDRLDETHLVVADVYRDGVFVVNTSRDGSDGRITTRWNATSLYTRDVGGKEGDWTHINDVEVLEDGRIMVSVRNMDQVIFLEPCGTGTAGGDGSNCTGYVANESWTIGAENEHDVLFEQHNPDYIPRERGGPAVVVGDSENNRIVEYQRVDGEWTRTWSWKDVQLQWPRDADRLPDDNTLITDTHGDRVAEVTPGGRVVWSVHIGMPYEAERLGTGDESTGGRSMARIRANRSEDDDSSAAENQSGPIDTESDRSSTAGVVGSVLLWLKSVLPSHLVNSALYAAPDWMQFAELVVAGVLGTTLAGWTGLEWHWSSRSIRSGIRHTGGWLRRRR